MATSTPQSGLVAECESDPGYTPHHNPTDADAVVEFNECQCCGEPGLLYRGFVGYGGRRSISVCPHCGDEQDF